MSLSRFWTPSSVRWNTARISSWGRGRYALAAAAFLSSLLLLAPLPRLAAGDKADGRLSVPDVLTFPGKPVRLEARLVRTALLGQPPLGGEQIEFVVEGRNAGQAMTGGDGRAFLEYTPRMRGNLKVVARLVESQRVKGQEAKGILFSWERRRPLLLVQTASVVEPLKSPSLPIPTVPIDSSPESMLKPVPEAATELKRLSEYYFNVVYISWGDQTDLGTAEQMREWLDQHQFPPGLRLRISGGPSAMNEKLDELKTEGWDNLKAGIGRSPAFAEVLSERRIPVIILPGSDRDEAKLPRKTAVIKSWTEVRKKLQG